MSAAKLLLIDPQNDFCDIAGAALPVTGASADMQRAAHFLHSASGVLDEVIVTLDSHPQIAIERTSFWMTGRGDAVATFTQISAAQVQAGDYQPYDPALLSEVTQYLTALEAAGRYRLMVWPIHCVIGTWGHNVHPEVAQALARWEGRRMRNSLKVLKGQNPLTEQYSAVRAEVPRSEDPTTATNHTLIERSRPGAGAQDYLFIAGEASSHCVRATVEHLFEAFTPAQRKSVVLLSDCMSPVTGFEAAQQEFFQWARQAGAQVLTSLQVLSIFAKIHLK